MDNVYLALNSLALLTGVSVAIIQYLFNNHQSNIKNLLSNIESLEFQEDNDYDKELEQLWEKTISKCKNHSYINPNKIIYIFLILIICIVALYPIVHMLIFFNIDVFTFFNIDVFTLINWFTLIISLALIITLITSFMVLNAIINKEDSYKKEF